MPRAIDPFSYFVNYASQLRGFGGDRPSPDPQYCFHTRYENVRPGGAIFTLTLLNAQASQGELTVCVHAFQPTFGGAPSLTAGNRLVLATTTRRDLAVKVPFHAIKGVEYALYGYFSEPTDLSVSQVEVQLDEPEGEEEIEIDAPLSILADSPIAQESGPATGLIHAEPARSDRPVSQDCTWAQLGSPRTVATVEDFRRWCETICITGLDIYGANRPGIDGWVVDEISSDMRQAMASKPAALLFRDGAGPIGKMEFADFILWPEGPSNQGKKSERWAQLHAWLERLKIGGLAVIGLRYQARESHSLAMSRNEIRQWVFRLISMGYSVAPLAFASPINLASDETGMAAFCMILKRQ